MNQISYPALNKMVKERGIKRVTISKAIGITEQTLRNKLQGKSKFKSDEMLMIQERFFPDITVTELFRPVL